MPLNIGDRLGHYDVTALIGERGYGAGVSGQRHHAERIRTPRHKIHEVNMIVVSNRIPVAPGHEEAFAERFRGRARLVEGHKGFVRLEILKPTEVATHGRAMGRCPYHVVLTIVTSNSLT